MQKYFLLFLLVASASSCKKILDVKSPNSVVDGDVFTSVAGLRNARIGMYATLQDKNYYGGVYPLLAECYTDNGTTGGYDVIDLNDIASRTVGTANIYSTGIYQSVYNSIYTANMIIGHIDAVPEVDPDEKSNILGEAYFVRALGEFDLLRMFGEHWDKTSKMGISLPLNTDNAAVPIARSTVDDSYKQIISDLQTSLNDLNTDNGEQYVSLAAATALLARVDLYYKDNSGAITMATGVIDNTAYSLFGPDDFSRIYTDRLTPESIFELKFDLQNPSAYNSLTYVREDALRSDVAFLVSADLDNFFQSRPDDRRSTLTDYVNQDGSINPDGRSQKYRGEAARDNSAFILRLAEMYLIRAEAAGRVAGLKDLNTVRLSRGMTALKPADVPTDDDYLSAVLDERRAELNFEGHRMFDQARTGTVPAGVNPIMPIPQREISAGNGIILQNDGY